MTLVLKQHKLTFGNKALEFYKNIALPDRLPADVEVMNPYVKGDVCLYTEQFLKNFFSDHRNRVYVFGINPGRFGAGVTGITFTDPVALEKFCGISNSLEKKREISSVFIYEFIQHWGGVEKFYRDFFLTAISPLGFVRHGINYNYYDNQKLIDILEPFIIKTLKEQINFGARRDSVIILGTGKNQSFFSRLNKEHSFFKKIYAIEHPRFIMQYRRRRLSEYLKKYKEIFSQALSSK